MARRALGIAAAATVAVLIGFAIALRSSDDGSTAVPAAAHGRIPPVAPDGPTVVATDRAASAAPSRPISLTLQREYLAATDLYAFAMRARERPAEGGWFYTSEAMTRCEPAAQASALDAEVAKTLAKRATVSAEQLDALEGYRRRCAGFTDGTRAELSRWLKDRAGRRDDPLLDIAVDLSAKTTPAAKRDALQALLDLADPLLASTMWRSFEKRRSR